jgi:tetratricopeptide (TPR) repeat protein
MSPLVNNRSSGENYPPHLLAQKLSNRASFFITSRNYDEGIVLLTKALKHVERNISATTMRQPCLCKCCSLDYCLAMEQDSYSSLLNNEKEKYHGGDNCQPSKDDKIDHVECDHYDNGKEYQHQTPADIKNHDGFVYRRPLLVPKRCVEEGHYMGISLSLIILYNLALAHHLKAISMISQSECDALSSPDKEKMQALKKALQLYQLAYQLQLDQNGGYLRFTMIISNNLGEIHRVAGNAKKHIMLLHHLLSAIMFMVDRKLVVLDSTEMDGFYHNVSQIMMSNKCAKAA